MGWHRLTATTTPTGGLGSSSGSGRLGLLWHVSGFRAGRWVAARCSPPCARFPAPERARASLRPTGQGAQTRGGRVQVILPESGDLGFLSLSPYRDSNSFQGASQSNPIPSCVLQGLVHTSKGPGSSPSPVPTVQPGPRKRRPTTVTGAPGSHYKVPHKLHGYRARGQHPLISNLKPRG